MNLAERIVDIETRLKKANIKLIRHPETCLYGGVILMGETSIVDDEKQCPTAYTDGYNKRYGRKFLEKLSDQEIAGLVLHETLHVMLKHIPRHRDLMKENSRLSNIAMDYVVNDIIVEIGKKFPTLLALPKGGCYDPMFHNWSVRRVYEYLKKEMQSGRGGGRPQTALDEHDGESMEGMTVEQVEEVGRKIDEAIHQGGMLAGRFGAKIPRVIEDLMQPDIDWREVLQDFWTSNVRGKDEFTWRRFNKNRLADDYYLPSTVNETIGEVILAIDTSGSIGNADIAKVASRVAELCETLPPDRVRVLWWDTEVHGEQVFEGNYAGIASMLKPMGGGGTRATCVSEYIIKNNLNADCMVVFTDGHLESSVKWDTAIPTVWLITENGHQAFDPPKGQKVIVKA
jgi:predicted metal-dependent peptidase